MGDETEPNFEEALAQLEQIVASLERGEPELTSALSKYEKGVQLLSICHRLLEKAEQSVALLTGVDEQGNALTASVRCHRDHGARAQRAPAVGRMPSLPRANPSARAQSDSSCAGAEPHPPNPRADPDDPPF